MTLRRAAALATTVFAASTCHAQGPAAAADAAASAPQGRQQIAYASLQDKRCQPMYPAGAFATRAMGTTSMQVSVDAGGHVVSVEVTTPSGPTPAHALLDASARATMLACPFSPALDADGHPVASTVRMDYRWEVR